MNIINYLKSETDAQVPHALPGPWGLPVLGYLPWLSQDRVFESFNDLRSQYGDLFQIKMGSWPVVVINGKKMLKECLEVHSAAFAGRPEFFTFQGYCEGSSLAFRDYDPCWRMQHKLVGQALGEMMRSTDNKIEGLMNHAISKTMHGITQRPSKAIDPQEPLRALAFEMACAMCFGKQSTTYEDSLSKQIIDTLVDIFNMRKPLQGVDIMPWTKVFMGKKMAAFRGKQNDFEQLMAKKIHKVITESTSEDRWECAVNALKVVGEENAEAMDDVGLSMYRLLQSVQDIIGAGADTVGNLPRWVLLYMVHFPAIQRKVQEELDGILGGEKRGQGRMATAEDMQKLPFTQSVILEVARHAAVVPMSIPRKTTEDVVINNCLIKKDSLVFANYHSAAHDANVWVDPETFRPERFLTESGEIDTAVVQQWPMFGYGKRRCIGEKFGRLETFLIVTAFLRRFQVRQIPGEELPVLGEGFCDISMEPGSFKIILDDRINRSSRAG
ncbi:hypothetical protein CAPTEDRAFT_227378 [Capitella teleta]|uniref:unspecific monooxygenase n=1 Tax=Capitella teleta TaxID=283909 RepID=R7UJ19_CAPTE|nr:hypothetical protein CAPTEDRAFT_227378 [Capitella teleta]|eukprot:ELU03287.1 hypothetical protein CAPTEDRAFT_227378 [Capitella teleta]